MLKRGLYAGAVLGLAVALLGLQFQARSVDHHTMVLDSGLPLVIFEPEAPASDSADRTAGPTRLPAEPVRWPVLVLAHGYNGSSAIMSTLARRLARAGYAVVCFDFAGHGQNPAAFPGGPEPGDRRPSLTDLESVLLFARTRPRFDPDRIALIGYGMGADAVLEEASIEPSVAAVIGISGGRRWNGPYRPPNVLLLWPSAESEPVKRRSRELAAALAGLNQVVLDRVYGEPERGSAVRAVEVDGSSRLGFVYTAAVAREILNWLEATLGSGVDSPASPNSVRTVAADKRGLWSALGLIAFAILLWGGAELFGSGIAPYVPLPPPKTPKTPLLAMAMALIGGGMLAWVGDPAVRSHPLGFIPLALARDPVGLLSLAGLGLAAWMLRSGRLTLEGLGDPITWLASASLFFGLYWVAGALFEPFVALWIGPRRAGWVLVIAALVLPFFGASEWLLRSATGPGRWLPAVGRILTLTALFVAIPGGAFPAELWPVLVCWIPFFGTMELLSWRLSRVAPNPWLLALLQAAWFGWIVAASSPLDA